MSVGNDSAALINVADNVPDIFVGRLNFLFHNRFKQDYSAFLQTFAVRVADGEAKSDFVGVRFAELTAENCQLDADEGESKLSAA